LPAQFHLPQLLSDKIDNGAMLVSINYVSKVSNGKSDADTEDGEKNGIISLILHIVTSIEGQTAHLGEH
jgi:hypothetical protein